MAKGCSILITAHEMLAFAEHNFRIFQAKILKEN